MNCNDRQERNTAYNTGFASCGVKCKLGALCFYSSSVLVDSFVLRNPPERKARNRYTIGCDAERIIDNSKKVIVGYDIIF